MRFSDPEALRRCSLFAGLADADLTQVAHASRIGEFPRGHLIFQRGDPADCMYLVLEGWLTVYRDTPNGERTVLLMARRGETVAEAAALNFGRFPASAEAATDCRIVQIPAKVFTDVIRKDPDAALRVIGGLSARLHLLVGELERLHVKGASQRVGCFLIELIPDAIGGNTTVQLPFDKSLVAARLAMTPESLSRALAKLKEVGVESTRGPDVHILDVQRLRDHCAME
jgi:CRP-like cAMP-binding protein